MLDDLLHRSRVFIFHAQSGLLKTKFYSGLEMENVNWGDKLNHDDMLKCHAPVGPAGTSKAKLSRVIFEFSVAVVQKDQITRETPGCKHPLSFSTRIIV